MRVVGLDLSLTGTGIAFVVNGKLEEDPIKIVSKGKEDATLADRQDRLHRLSRRITAQTSGADLVVVEGPSYGSTGGQQHDRAGLWWLVVDWIAIDFGKQVVEVSPNSRSKYATGKGNVGKDAVLAAVIRRYPQVEVRGNNEADALILAAMGARALGEPVEQSLPATNLQAMEKVAWTA